jgi:N-acetyl-anhydromuramyl-L-alanine amidase AmpD
MPRKSTLAIVVHCTATMAHQAHNAKSIREMHMIPKKKGGQGFSDIGYHYLITLAGKVETGRAENAIGAHVGGFNHNTIGIAYVGGLLSKTAKPADTRNPAQIKAMTELLARLVKKYPGAVILGHRDLSPDKNGNGKIEPGEWLKVCPCFNAPAWAKSVGLPGGKFSRGKFSRI